jgi:hypothetical protein
MNYFKNILLKTKKTYETNEKYENYLNEFLLALESGNLYNVEYIYSNMVQNKNMDTTFIQVCFYDTCISNYIHVAKWLFSTFPIIFQNNLDDSMNISFYQTIFTHICNNNKKNSYLEMIEWVYSIKPHYLDGDISRIISTAFDGITIMKFAELATHKCFDIKIFNYQNMGFIKYLYNLNPGMEESLIEAFNYAVAYNDIEVVKWLHQIKPYHFQLLIDESSQKIIQHSVVPEKERKWNSRKTVIQLSNITTKPTNFIRKLPEDLVRLTMSYV